MCSRHSITRINLYYTSLLEARYMSRDISWIIMRICPQTNPPWGSLTASWHKRIRVHMATPIWGCSLSSTSLPGAINLSLDMLHHAIFVQTAIQRWFSGCVFHRSQIENRIGLTLLAPGLYQALYWVEMTDRTSRSRTSCTDPFLSSGVGDTIARMSLTSSSEF